MAFYFLKLPLDGTYIYKRNLADDENEICKTNCVYYKIGRVFRTKHNYSGFYHIRILNPMN